MKVGFARIIIEIIKNEMFLIALTVNCGLNVQRCFALKIECQEYGHDKRSLHSNDNEHRLQTDVLLADVYVGEYLHGLIFDNDESINGDESR